MAKFSAVRFLEASGGEDAPLWLWGIPYDGTMSHRPGARFGPDEIRNASQGIESYSPYQGKDLVDLVIHDAGNIDLPFSSPEKAVEEIRSFARDLLRRGIRSCVMGGEHSASAPLVGAAFERYPDLAVLHFDAHCDMRQSYGGNPLSHASVARRILDFLPAFRYYALGMRSGDRDEFEFARALPHFHPFTLKDVPAVADSIPKDRPLYVTIDLDILDTAFFPGTGAPEPMGVSVKALHDALLRFKGFGIVGADVMELSPHYDTSRASSAVASFIVREMLLLMG